MIKGIVYFFDASDHTHEPECFETKSLGLAINIVGDIYAKACKGERPPISKITIEGDPGWMIIDRFYKKEKTLTN